VISSKAAPQRRRVKPRSCEEDEHEDLSPPRSNAAGEKTKKEDRAMGNCAVGNDGDDDRRYKEPINCSSWTTMVTASCLLAVSFLLAASSASDSR
jgi:hypothetical protein